MLDFPQVSAFIPPCAKTSDFAEEKLNRVFILHAKKHAYLIVLTGDDDGARDRNDSHDAEHGLNFRKCVAGVNWNIKAGGGQTWIRTSVGRDWVGAGAGA